MKEFSSKKELRKYIRPVFQLINETYAEIYGFAELENEEMDFMANRYMMILNPKFIKVVLDKHNQMAAFIIAMPEMAGGIIRARGRLFPFGFLHILWERKRSKMLTLYLGAIKEEYRGSGLDALMGTKILETAQKEKMAFMDSHLVLENNIRMRREYERLGGLIYKKYRIYKKEL
jgi:ribosomal protein S18 acetylase RimI-like enzyme